ncbi:hypothetical protein ZQ72_26450 [Salmonella enterica subsp. enterica]|nr:hypothetical protein [Salmonella enterica subsp. enterica serovar Virchow]MIP73537.1 hypothetical protein [Salmonella enterica subsp. enterica]
MSKLIVWWRRLFFGHEERELYKQALSARKEYEAQLHEEKVFIYAALEYMLRKDFTREEILTVLWQGEDTVFRDKVRRRVLEMNDGVMPPDIMETPVFDFPISPERKSTEAPQSYEVGRLFVNP